MKNSNKLKKAYTLSIAMALFAHTQLTAQCVAPSVGCSNNDRSNAFLNSGNPATIEYDNIVSTFHSTMARQADGTVWVWGERMHNDGVTEISTPQILNATNYPSLTGEVLKFTGGSRDIGHEQFVVLTTTGLFAWGEGSANADWQNLLSSGITTTTAFQKIAVDGQPDGLPAGVDPADVKMLFGSYRTLALVTCSGDAWVMSTLGNKNGDGTFDNVISNQNKWHRVKTNSTSNLTGVVALRGGNFAMMALKNDGTLWTWGDVTYLGDGTARTSNTYATQMTLPSLAAGEVPKMIGTIGLNDLDFQKTATYYLLTSAGNLYSLGTNNTTNPYILSTNLLGDYTTVNESLNWVQVKKSAAANDYLTNIAWISPQEHDALYGAINVLTNTGVLYAWGANDKQMLGGATPQMNPIAMPGGLSASDKILAVETGGHTSIVVKQCTGLFGYVGHHVNGSMADGTTTDALQNVYNFTETSVLNLCSANSGAAVLYPVTGSVTPSQSIQLSFAPAGGSFTVTGPATVSPTGELTATGAGTINVTYAVYGACGTTQSDITVNVTGSLSVNFGNIQARLNGNTLMVDWTTLKEDNNSYFEIEASADGKNFTKIGETKTQAQNGNSSVSLQYHFSQAISAGALQLGGGLMILSALAMGFKRRKLWGVVALVAGSSLFLAGCAKNDGIEKNEAKVLVRIAQVDKDGTRSYSKIIKATEQ